MTLVELTAKSRDLRQEMFNLRLQQASASWKSRRACARCAGTSPASKPAFRNCANKAA